MPLIHLYACFAIGTAIWHGTMFAVFGSVDWETIGDSFYWTGTALLGVHFFCRLGARP